MRQEIFFVGEQNALTVLERRAVPGENSLRKDLRVLEPGTEGQLPKVLKPGTENAQD